MIWLIFAFVLLLLTLLLGMPIPVRVRARIGVRGGPIRLCAYAFGLIPIRFRFRLALLSHPYMTLLWRNKKIDLLKRKSKGPKFRLRGISCLYSKSTVTVGISEDAAAAAGLLGLLTVVLSMLTPQFARQGTVSPVLSPAHSVLRLTWQATFLFYPHHFLFDLLRSRIKRLGNGNNRRKSTEKRSAYESC